LKRLACFIIVLSFTNLIQAEDKILELSNLDSRDITYAGFVLDQDKNVHIRAVGAGAKRELRRVKNSYDDETNMFAYAWILNSKTREMVWRMDIDNTERDRSTEWNRIFDEDVSLKKGEYEVYFSNTFSNIFGWGEGYITFGRIMKKIFSDDDLWEEDSEDWKVEIEYVDRILDRQDINAKIEELKDHAIINMTDMRDEDSSSQGITITKPLKVEIYAAGEGFKREMYDYGWIIDAQTREKIWSMREGGSEHGGGAAKNLVSRERITLKPGDYLFYYRTDDSHSYEEWNSNPPYDPHFWGLTVWPADKKDASDYYTKYSEKRQKAIVDITRVGDFAYIEKGLLINKPSKIRIYALGEGDEDEMFDYGWISDADDGDIVWKMRYRKTRHAGGADKNRCFDGVIDLDEGRYLVHYQSDDSHSYEDWNSSKPDDPEKWGISIYPVGKFTHAEHVKLSKLEPKGVLASLVRVGDDERLRKQFSIDERTRVRIYCIGEGDEDELYDYGWLENMDTGERVWKMRYRNTKRAGGAEKNRTADTVLTLEPGTYRVHYRSDDSHSFNRWNSAEPRDERNWGITIYQLDN